MLHLLQFPPAYYETLELYGNCKDGEMLLIGAYKERKQQVELMQGIIDKQNSLIEKLAVPDDSKPKNSNRGLLFGLGVVVGGVVGYVVFD